MFMFNAHDSDVSPAEPSYDKRRELYLFRKQNVDKQWT